jgi:cell division protein FtsL
MRSAKPLRRTKVMARPLNKRAQAAPKDKLRLIDLRPTAGMMLLLPFSVIVLFALALVWGRVQIDQLAVRIAGLEQQKQQLLDRNEKLRIQIERLSSYGRISQIAGAHAGLKPMRPQLLVVEK